MITSLAPHIGKTMLLQKPPVMANLVEIVAIYQVDAGQTMTAERI